MLLIWQIGLICLVLLGDIFLLLAVVWGAHELFDLLRRRFYP